MPNFIKIGQSVANIFKFFDYSRWRPPLSCIVEFAKNYWLTVSVRHRRITVPNVVKIGRSIVEILRFFEFLKWPPSPSWIFESRNFIGYLGAETRVISVSMPNFIKISQSVAKILKIFDFSRWRPSAILDLFGAHLYHPQ